MHKKNDNEKINLRQTQKILIQGSPPPLLSEKCHITSHYKKCETLKFDFFLSVFILSLVLPSRWQPKFPQAFSFKLMTMKDMFITWQFYASEETNWTAFEEDFPILFENLGYQQIFLTFLILIIFFFTYGRVNRAICKYYAEIWLKRNPWQLKSQFIYQTHIWVVLFCFRNNFFFQC